MPQSLATISASRPHLDRTIRLDPSRPEGGPSRGRSEQDDDEEDEEQQQEIITGPTRRSTSKALEASKLLLRLARGAADGSYASPENKSPYQLFIEWLELTEKYPEEIGLDPEEEKQSLQEQVGTSSTTGAAANGRQSTHKPQGAARRSPAFKQRDLKGVVRQPGGDRASRSFPSQRDKDHQRRRTRPIRGPVGTTLDRSRNVLDQARRVRVGARYIRSRHEGRQDSPRLYSDLRRLRRNERERDRVHDGRTGRRREEQDDEEEPREEKEAELDRRMQEFEELMERRPFLVNDVLLRRNPDDVQEWEKRVVLYGDNDDKIIETYREAISKINPRKATANFHQMFLNFAQFTSMEDLRAWQSFRATLPKAKMQRRQQGSRGSLDRRARSSKAITIPFRRVDDLAEIWCEWAEMELRHSNYDEAIRIMARSVAPPRNTKGVQYHDETLPPQTRLFKSLKLWSFYVDLEESLGDVESTKRVLRKDARAQDCQRADHHQLRRLLERQQVL